jgi:hypothetical protein
VVQQKMTCDVDAAIVVQNQDLQILQHFLSFLWTQIWIVGQLLFDLVGGQWSSSPKAFNSK